MPTPNEIKVAKILTNHKASIEESKTRLTVLESKVTPKQSWIVASLIANGVMALLLLATLILLTSTRSRVTTLEDARHMRQATDAEIRAMIDAQPAAEVAAALGPVKRHKRVAAVVDAGATQVQSEPAAPAVQAGALPAGGQ